MAAIRRHLSVAPDEMAAAIERVQLENKAVQKIARGLQEKLAVHEATTLLGRGRSMGGRLVIVEAIEGWDAQALNAMAVAAAASQPMAAIALFTTSSPALAVVARGSAVTLDASSVVRSLVGRFGGKGGGKPDLAQGGGLAGSTVDLLEAARRLLAPEPGTSRPH
jgi:alanyl-tRNA synthetase